MKIRKISSLSGVGKLGEWINKPMQVTTPIMPRRLIRCFFNIFEYYRLNQEAAERLDNARALLIYVMIIDQKP